MAAFTAHYLATALPDSLLNATIPQARNDLLIVTCTGALLDAFRHRLAASIFSTSALTLEATVGTVHHAYPYRLVVHQLQHCEDADELIDALTKHQPHYLLFADFGVRVSNKVKQGDVVMARLVWRYEGTETGIVVDHALSRRPARAVINAAQSLDSQGVVHAGTIASGNSDTFIEYKALIDEILRVNPRTLVADNESALFVEAIARHRAEKGWPLFVNMQAVHTVLGEEKVEKRVAAENLAASVVELIQRAWPVRPMGS